jgi:hypothetical protein
MINDIFLNIDLNKYTDFLGVAIAFCFGYVVLQDKDIVVSFIENTKVFFSNYIKSEVSKLALQHLQEEKGRARKRDANPDIDTTIKTHENYEKTLNKRNKYLQFLTRIIDIVKILDNSLRDNLPRLAFLCGFYSIILLCIAPIWTENNSLKFFCGISVITILLASILFFVFEYIKWQKRIRAANIILIFSCIIIVGALFVFFKPMFPLPEPCIQSFLYEYSIVLSLCSLFLFIIYFFLHPIVQFLFSGICLLLCYFVRFICHYQVNLLKKKIKDSYSKPIDDII